MMKKALKYIGKGLLIVFTVLAWVVIVLAMTIRIICFGPSTEARNLFVTTMLETGQLKWVVGLFMSDEQVMEIVNANSMVVMEEDSDASLITVAEGEEAVEYPELVVEKVAGDNFSGTMMIVRDPSRVFVGTIYPWGEYGKELHEIVESYGAVAGINGGLYASYMNTGGRPIGPVVSQGEIQNMAELETVGLVLIGLSEDHILHIIDIAGKGRAEVEAIIADNRIRDAICFQEEASDANNHFVKLIINGERREMNGLGSGANPRTAIGQTADGRILLFVTDGRGANGHLGATASDLISVMEQYGAVNAANLDGGSSSSMYYDGEYLRTSVTFYYNNSSWKLPTTILVRP
ncbi:MAG: phosphodiester glycosidase family protein [Lachnospiraceae bacterium]|nr:phosphodiester glycosidase family protein [Lachnospiraceae bacterium]